MEEIQNKLDELHNKLQELRSISYQDGKNEYKKTTQFLERIIFRIYPEKDAKQIKSKLYDDLFVVYERTEVQDQEEYVYAIDLAIRVIETIKAENELFGFEEFKPLKEKVKTEKQIGGEIWGLSYKKTTEK